MVNEKEFINRLDKYKSLEVKKKKEFDIASNARLIVFLLGVGSIIVSFVNGKTSLGIITLIIFLTMFIYLIIKHYHIERKLKRVRCKIKINKMFIDRIRGRWIDFKDCGQEFQNPKHEYTGDLDVFGPRSLFQFISVANTYYGRIILKNLLQKPNKDRQLIKNRQEAVEELSSKLDFTEQLQCESMIEEKMLNNPEELLSYAEDSSKMFKSKRIIYLLKVLPAITVFSFILSLNTTILSIYFSIGLLVLQGILFLVGFKKTSAVLSTICKFKNNLEGLNNLAELIEIEEFESSYLAKLKSELYCNSKSASDCIKTLSKIEDAINLRYNPIIYFLLNIGLLWDYECSFALENWKNEYGKSIRIWFRVIGHYEALSSLAVLKQIDSRVVFPTILEQNSIFRATEIAHPLINLDKCIRNDINIKENYSVVTGSNMSGKTTLLRTIGINLVLAYSGAPVFAKSLECSSMEIFTSMRINDDLNSGISTFYAELLRIKMIIDYSHKKVPMIYLIDEIFRGTNSKDRIIGAKSVLKNLNKEWIIGLISTHDFELCDLEHEKNMSIENYHFTEHYVNNEIKFDYKLKLGRCNTTNAKYLMEMVGIEL